MKGIPKRLNKIAFNVVQKYIKKTSRFQLSMNICHHIGFIKPNPVKVEWRCSFHNVTNIVLHFDYYLVMYYLQSSTCKKALISPLYLYASCFIKSLQAHLELRMFFPHGLPPVPHYNVITSALSQSWKFLCSWHTGWKSSPHFSCIANRWVR